MSSRRKNRDGRSRVSRGEPMPWLSWRLAGQRPVFALTLQRIMSGCEMVDYGSPTSQSMEELCKLELTEPKIEEEQQRSIDIARIEAGLEEPRLTPDCNDNTIFEEISELEQSETPKLTGDEQLVQQEDGYVDWWVEDAATPTAIGKDETLSSYYDLVATATASSANELQQLSSGYSGQQLDNGMLMSQLLPSAGSNAQFCDLDAYQTDSRLMPICQPVNRQLVEMTSNLVHRQPGLEAVTPGKRKRKQDEEERRVSCNRCGKRFRKEGHLKSHFAVHTAAETGAITCPCPVCGKGFCHRGALALHMRAHLPKQNKKAEVY